MKLFKIEIKNVFKCIYVYTNNTVTRIKELQLP